MTIRGRDLASEEAAAGASSRLQYRSAVQAGRRRRVFRLAAAICGVLLVAVGLVGSGRWLGAARAEGGLSGGLVVAGFVLVVAALLVRVDRDPERWLRGAAGEETSATLLRALGSRRWYVLHDRGVPGFTVNLDHLVIGPTGVWVVDTKTYRAPLRARWHRVEAGGRAIDTGPVAWEAELVSERLGVWATPIVAVHGSGLARRGRRSGGVRIVPASALVWRLRRGPRILRRRILGRREASDLAARADRCFGPRVRGSKR